MPTSIKHVIGSVLVASPLVLVFCMIAYQDGIKCALRTFGTTLLVIGVFVLGLYLLGVR